jgi:predicted unusual protein kinase regulating ubiquinone biosynthesis (AarF/ABC1/UbiB family)
MARLTRLFVDAATENVGALPRRLSDLGVRYPREREDELRSRLEELYYRYYGSRLSDIDPVEAIREGLGLIYAMNLRLPTRFVILDKAIATLGSVAAEVYPDFNVFEVALVILGGLVGSSLIGVLADDGPQILGLHLLSVVGFVISGAFGLWLMWGVVRSGRL